MRFNYLDPNEPSQKPTLPFVVIFHDGEGKGEADCPKALAALVLGGEYADVDDEYVACAMRMKEARGAAVWHAAVSGEAVRVLDAGPDGPVVVWESEAAKAAPGAPARVIRTDGDWAFLATLHNLGAIDLYERADARCFRDPLPKPASCAECAYYKPASGDHPGDEPFCEQFLAALPGPEMAQKCLDGIRAEALGTEGAEYAAIPRNIPVAPERLRAPEKKRQAPNREESG